MNHDTSNTNISNLSTMPQPISWLTDFINKYFTNMPKAVQVLVFLLFVAYFIIATVRFLWPVLFPDEYIEVRGEVTFLSSEALPDSVSYIEFSGEGLYVYKKPVGLGDKFTYEWILKSPRNKYSEKLRLIFSKYDQTGGKQIYLTGIVISPKELKQLSSDGKVHLEVDELFTQIFTEIENLDPELEPIESTDITGLFIASAYAQENDTTAQMMTIDTVNYLIDQFIQYRNPVAKLKIIDMISSVDTAIVIAQAERFKHAVITGNKEETANLSYILANLDLVTILSQDERYRSIFDSLFYDQVTQLFKTKDDYIVRGLAELLTRLKDPRCIDSVFEQYLSIDDIRTRLLILNVLNGFTDHPDSTIKRKIHTELKTWSDSTDSKPLEVPVKRQLIESVNRYERRESKQ